MTTTDYAPHTASLTAVSALQGVLPELAALSLQAKQAHWNLTGPGFLPLHALTDQIADAARAWADRVAERAVALGFSVDARPATVATALGPFPAGRIADHEVVTELIGALEGISVGARASLADLGEADPVAHDIVTAVVEGLDKFRWLLRAQML